MKHGYGWLIGCLVLSPAVPAPAAPAPKVRGYATPQACFKAFRAAVKKGDWKAAFACWTDEARDQTAGYCVAFVAWSATEEMPVRGSRKVLEAAAARHGVSREFMGLVRQAMQADRGLDPWVELGKFGKGVKDRAGFIAAVLGSQWKAEYPPARGVLKGLKITGMRATATLVVPPGSGAGRYDLTFTREKGGWRMGFPKDDPGKK